MTPLRLLPLAVVPMLLIAAMPVATGEAVTPLVRAQATFVDADGAHPATFEWRGPCNGIGHATLTVHKADGDESHIAQAKSIMQPDPCSFACVGCPVPFGWVLQTGLGETLVGGGMVGLEAGRAWTLQGPFSDGAVQVRDVRSTLVDV